MRAAVRHNDCQVLVMVRHIAIWATGLPGSLLVMWGLGAAAGNYDAGFIAGVGAMLAFACARLWAGERR